ncbi:MAG: PQQ-binding-like beta-propeller repeat protein [Planctomycetes bacterium]|nr:PQQ-binding-like beta-propeller repeat protein [Planctomycetota bacterium]
MNRPLTDAVREAWRCTVDGQIVGEPRVWDGWVVLEVLGKKDRRALHMVRLADGECLYKTRGYEVPGPLAPCLGQRTVVARTGTNELTVYRLERTELRLLWRLMTDVPAGEPLVNRSEIYFHNGRQLCRYQFARPAAVWKTDGTYRGRLALRGGQLYVLDYDGNGVGWLVLVDRETGRSLERREAAYHGGKVPEFPDATRICVGSDRVYVRLALGVECQGGVTASACRLSRTRSANGAVSIGAGQFLNLPSDPALHHERVLRVEQCQLVPEGSEEPSAGEETWAWIWGSHDQDDRVLAHRYFHRSLLDVRTPPTVVGNACYLGPVAFDLESLRVFWRQPIRSGVRLVPARGTLLAVEDDHTLVAYREVSAILKGALHRASARAAPDRPKLDEPVPAVAHLRDGSRERGTFEIHRESPRGLVRVAPVHRRGTWPLADVLLVLDDQGRPVYCGSQEDVIQALDREIDDEVAQGYEKLLAKSCRTNDARAIERLLADAWLQGVSDKVAREAESKLKMLAKKSPRVNADLVARLQAEEQGLLGQAVGRLEAPLARMDARRDIRVKIAFLKAMLRRDPHQPAAVAAVRAMLPAGILAPEPLHALDWLDFLEVIEATPVAFVKPPTPGAELSREQQELAKASKGWRRDVVGIQSDRLFLLTPLTQPGRIARCLALGELVCDHLDSLFGPLGKPRGAGHRLKIYLHDSQEDYLQQSGGAEVADHLQWSAGHYNKEQRHSRMFLPPGADAFERVMDVFAHELTHQWVDERCPLFTEDERFRSPWMQPCFWIMEGIASWMEEARFDLERGVVQTFNPRCRHLDILASLVEAKGPRLEWKDLFTFTQIQFSMIPRGPEKGFVAESHWRLGALHQLGWTQLFYVQAAAATQYLFHAAGGRHREQLLRCVGHYYKGHYGLVDVPRAFGVSPEELGRRIESFALEVRKGWTPAR